MTRRRPTGLLATCVVPWDERFNLLEVDFREHLGIIARDLTTDVYIFGTAGEGYAVDDGQYRTIAEVFFDEATALGVSPMLGVISLSLSTIVSRIALGRSIGFREFQLSFPSWGVLTPAERDLFFAETCGRFEDCRFLHYNTLRSGVLLKGADYSRLARVHENLVAVKFSSSQASTVHELVVNADPLQCYLTEYAYALAKEQHECGLLVSLSGVRGSLARALVEARGKRLEEVMKVIAAIDDLLGQSVDREQVHMDGAEEKLIARTHGARLPLRLLPPYASADERGYELFAAGVARLLATIGL